MALGAHWSQVGSQTELAWDSRPGDSRGHSALSHVQLLKAAHFLWFHSFAFGASNARMILKDPRDYVKPTQIIQDNLPILRSAD